MHHPIDLRPLLSRRRVLAGLGGAGLALAGFSPPGAAMAAPLPGGSLTVGVLYAGSRADFGYNQAHADAARRMAALPGVTVAEVEYPAGGLDAALASLAGRDGCGLIIATRPDALVSGIVTQAAAHPGTAFLLSGGGTAGAGMPPNVGTGEGFLNEAQHISGLVAGYAGRGKRVGFVASSRSPRALRSINAFALGVRRADPSVTVRLVFVGADAGPERLADAARALVQEHKVDVLAGYHDSLRPVCEVAEALGVQCCGLHTDLSFFAPQGFLTGAEWDWGELYAATAAAVLAGTPRPAVTRGGFSAGLVRNTAYGPPVTAEARAHADAARMQLANGNAAVFRGPITDNTGRLVLPRGKSLSSSDDALDRMAWLVEGIVEIVR